MSSTTDRSNTKFPVIMARVPRDIEDPEMYLIAKGFVIVTPKYTEPNLYLYTPHVVVTPGLVPASLSPAVG